MPIARPTAQLLLSAGVVSLAGAVALSITIASAAFGGAPDAGSASDGLPPTDGSADASLHALVAELDRSAGTIIAEIGSHTVTWGDMADAIRMMPTIGGGLSTSALYQKVGVQLMQQEAVVLRGESTRLDKDPVVRRRMNNAASQALAVEVLRRSLAPNLTDKALRETYNALVANKLAPEEVRARVIMVDTKAEAVSLTQRLLNGAAFGDLARDFSKDGTAADGGDMGYARLDMLNPELGSVIFALAPGQTTAYPVRSQNAWFIVRVEARRQPAAPSFEAARGALEQDIIHAGAPELMREALQAAPAKYYGMAGKKAP